MARHAAHILLAAVLLLIGLGLVMLVSTGAWADDARNDVFVSVKRQFLWLGLSVVVGGVLARVPYLFWWRFVPWIYGLACVLLVLCFVPKVGVSINGSNRWINLRAMGLSAAQIQPSEFAKLAVVFALAAWYARIGGQRSREWGAGFLAPMAMALVPIALVGAEVDLGAATLIGLASFAVMFAAGANLFAIGSSVIGGVAAIGGAIVFIPNRTKRFMEFLDVVKNPMAHLQDTGMQQVRGMMAFASGGPSGTGLGSGQQKTGLPYAHTDFIFPMVGEELGLWATLAVVFCYVVILVCGMLIALHAPERFGKLLGMGIVVLIAFQAVLNIAVTTACLPNKGLPLPLVSYGGSNLLFCLAGVGLLLNLHRHAIYPERAAATEMPRRRITPRA